MIGISKLYCGAIEPTSDRLRYHKPPVDPETGLLKFARDKKPVVVWNCTRTCNLKCEHCYAQSDAKRYDQLSTDEAKAMIDDLAAFGVPAMLFSGGEPCVRPDLLELMQYAKDAGIRVTISTNGTLITPEFAQEFAKIGIAYVGVSFDGDPETHDRFRGVPGSFDAALRGLHNAQDAGIKTGLRFTINKHNWREVDGIFDLMQREGIDRACFYHLVYSGRGTTMIDEDLTHEESRQVVRLIMDRTKQWFDQGGKPEILTVDNHADAPFVYLQLLRENPERASRVMELLQWNQGNSSGNAIGCVSWDGEVYADQFWRHFSFGNVKDRPFSEIWSDTSRTDERSELMYKLKDKRPWVKGRCHECRWLDVCGGNFRVRAEAATGDLWESDPACFLTDEEIARHPDDPEKRVVDPPNPADVEEAARIAAAESAARKGEGARRA